MDPATASSKMAVNTTDLSQVLSIVNILFVVNSLFRLLRGVKKILQEKKSTFKMKTYFSCNACLLYPVTIFNLIICLRSTQPLKKRE